MNIDNERIQIVSTLLSLQNANGQPYISTEWLKRNILKISREDEIKLKREERIKKLNKINVQN